MKTFRISFVSLALLTLLLGVIYPVFMWGIGQIFFHKKANGMLLYRKGQLIGAETIAQNFTGDLYFHPRPSAAEFNAAHSAASNLGPTSQALIDAVHERAATYRLKNNWQGPIPADAVTASGSGLDPHISPENAHIQAPRIASLRKISLDDVHQLIAQHTEGPSFGLFGERRVNVLRLNISLDEL